MTRVTSALLLAGMLVLSGCGADRETGRRTLTGTAVGAASGAALGLVSGGFVGAVVGGTVAGAAGGLTYDQVQKAQH